MKWKLHLPIFLSIFFLFFYYISSYQNNFFITYEIKIIEDDNRWMGELYYSDNSSYNSQDRIQTRYNRYKKKTFQHITEKIKNIKPIHQIRWDPLLQKGRVEVKNFIIYYQSQKYQIDFSKISDHYKNNIKTTKATKSGAILESTGNDPFIELTNNIDFNTFNIRNAGQALIQTLLLYLFIIMVKLYSSVKVFSVSILVVYTCYVLLFFSNIMAFNLLTAFALASLFMVLSNNPSNLFAYAKHIGVFLFFYLLIGYVSLFITTEVAYPNYFYSKIPLITLALMLPIGFYNMKKFDMRFFKIILTILLIAMAIIIIALNLEIFSIHRQHFYDFIFYRTPWTQKNYTFWYLVLMFGTLAFYNVKNKFDLLIIFTIITLSSFVIFSGYSQSAKFGYLIGICIYAALSLFQIEKKHLLIITWIFTFYIIFSPIIFSFIDLSSHPGLESRITIYKTAFALIKEHWLFGYGFGSTLLVNIKDFVSVIDLPKNHIDTFQGGHPHNLALLFWLEFGMIGATFLAYYIHKLLVYIIENTYNYINQAAVLSMVVAFAIITSFSWSIWWPSILLTFAFFGIMLTLSMNIKSLKIKPVKT